ncbi:hypothetical protein LSH36_143g06060 [Paralvinella palmiformis]|uniref:ATP synthase mitochondrial F1 complex assembly factor 1 n=1 Tax=Paralvinella palmiformis TaxID=53620 RepID=A0AAD9JVB0_9ANNE|nr:hypothetical protein LSH36_143g06060 [Paralvinella palmiformis]
MWSRLRFSYRSVTMSRKMPATKSVLPPGVYLQIAPASSQSAQQQFDITSNPLYHKYADKLKHLKETNPTLYEEKMEKLREMYNNESDQSASEEISATHDEGSSVDPETIEEPGKDKLFDKISQTKPKTLNSIMKLELLADKTVEEIEQIWKEYHSKKPYVFAVITREEFDEIDRHLKEFPTFLYPVPRGTGYEFFAQQTSQNSCYFTPLLAYQTHKENAPSCLTLDHYTDLKEEKGIVLMRGEVDKNILGIHEAQLLALQVKIYYGLQSALKFNLVRQFNNDPANFRYMDLIKEFENYKKDFKEYMTEFKRD